MLSEQQWLKQAQGGDLVGAMAAYVAAHDCATLAEVQSFFDGTIEMSGSVSLELHNDKASNIVFWDGISQAFADALNAATGPDGPLTYEASSTLAYLFDGRALQLPITKQARHYKSPHWLPVCLRLKAKAEVTERGQR